MHACKTRCTPVKRDRKPPAQKVQGMVSSRTRLERDQKEIPIRIIWGHHGTRQGSIPAYTRFSWNTSKRDTRWKARLAWIWVIKICRRSANGWMRRTSKYQGPVDRGGGGFKRGGGFSIWTCPSVFGLCLSSNLVRLINQRGKRVFRVFWGGGKLELFHSRRAIWNIFQSLGPWGVR